MSEKRLPQVGEVWFRHDGIERGPLYALIPHQSGRTLGARNGGHYYPDGSLFPNDQANLALIHKDASGKVINPVFDPALIGKPEAQGKPAKPPKPDPLAQAIAEAQERVQGLLSLKETYHSIAERKKVIASERGCIGGLEEKVKELRAKWLPEKPKAAKAGRKVK